MGTDLRLQIAGRVVSGQGQATEILLPGGAAAVPVGRQGAFADSALVGFLGKPEWQEYLVSNSHRGDPFVDRIFDPVHAVVDVPPAVWADLGSANARASGRNA